METIIGKLIEYIGRQMPEINIVDEDYGQIENLEEEDKDMYPLTFPAVLIEIPETTWSDISGPNQKGTATIRVRLAIDCYDDTHDGYDNHLMKAMERSLMSRTLHHFLQGFRPLDNEAMDRIKTRFYTYNHGIKIYEHTYTLTVSDILPEQTVPKPNKIILKTSGNGIP